MSNTKCKIESSVANLIKTKKKYLYTCNCLHCNGKEVDYRTQEKHTKDKSLWKSENAKKNQENAIMARKQKKSTINIHDKNPTEVNSNIPKKQKRDSHHASS